MVVGQHRTGSVMQQLVVVVTIGRRRGSVIEPSTVAWLGCQRDSVIAVVKQHRTGSVIEPSVVVRRGPYPVVRALVEHITDSVAIVPVVS